jgi:hypothetical protein
MKDDYVVQLLGGLGNQLFQFAAGRGLQQDPVGPVLVDSRLKAQWGEPLESALLPRSFREVRGRELLRLHQVPHLRFAQRKALLTFNGIGLKRGSPVRSLTRPTLLEGEERNRFGRWLTKYSFQESPDLGFDSRIDEISPPMIVMGYFQSERYFEHRAEQVALSFRPQPPECGKLQSRLDALSGGKPVVAISLRSGPDYAAGGWVLRAEYYLRATELLADRLGEVFFLIVGDVESDAEKLRILVRSCGPSVSFASATAMEQLHLIAAQPHAILANSSFAWWGGWLGDWRSRSAGRLVVYPQPWIPDNGGQVCPNRWMAVPACFTVKESDAM